MGSYGLTKGTRHYIQYQLTADKPWTDLVFIDLADNGKIHGLWCSRSYSAANARIEELMAECDTDRSQYRIVRRTWDEQVLEHDPNRGKAFNDPNYYDPNEDSGVFQLVVSTYDVSETNDDLSEIDVTVTVIGGPDAEGKTEIRITGTRTSVIAAAQELDVDVDKVQPLVEPHTEDPEPPVNTPVDNPLVK